MDNSNLDKSNFSGLVGMDAWLEWVQERIGEEVEIASAENVWGILL